MHPILNFKIDPSKDLEVLHGFLRDAKYAGGRNLDWAVFNKHPAMKDLIGEKFEIKSEASVEKYILDYFEKNKVEIKTNINNYAKEWSKKDKDYFDLVTSIFSDRPWPKGQYLAYATIWGMFPRSLEDKTFQIPAIYDNKLYVNVIIAHEMLHFMFYDYFYQKYPDYNNKDANFLVWNVSEIFNSVVQNSEPWLRVFNLKTMTYPEHEKIEADLHFRYQIINSKNLAQLTEELLDLSKTLI
ncbi:MAG: hypothetical protein WCW31_01275 [Patescibacteria group bacterium]|jgi:hypothetical protein